MGLVALLAFLLYAAAEVVALLELSRAFGLGWVLGWVAVSAVLGLAALRTQGIASLRRTATQLDQEILPVREVVDLALVVLASVLLISPGILADGLGLFLLIPACRTFVGHVILHLLPGWIPEDTALPAPSRAGSTAAGGNAIGAPGPGAPANGAKDVGGTNAKPAGAEHGPQR